MDPNPEILEISSDDGGTWNEGSDDNLDWISELLGDETGDSDDVVFVGENEISKSSERSKPVYEDDLDDDCTILESDPNNSVAAVNDSADGSDDLLIVGEKGQQACRDYPHSRHLCAKFPFSSTPHVKCCDLCYCYVCDLHAPCKYWGTGILSGDHCHSTDKEDKWKIQRKYFKQGVLVPTPGQKLPSNALPMMPPLPNQSLLFNPLQEPSSDSVTHSVCIPPLRPCSSATSFGLPSIIGHRSNQQPVLPLNRRCHQSLNRSLLTHGTKNPIRREKNEAVGALGPQLTTQRFKRAGSMPFSMNQHRYGSSNSRNPYKSHSPRNHDPLIMPNEVINMSWQDILAGSDPTGSCENSSQPNTVSSFSDFQSYPTSQPHVYSQPIPQSAGAQNVYQHENSTPVAENPGQSAGDQNVYQHENSTPVAENHGASDFNSDWMDGSTQVAQCPTADASQIGGLPPTPDLLPVQSMYQNESLPSNAADPQYTDIRNPAASEFHLDGWIGSPGYDPDPRITKESVTSELDFVPLQPTPVEPGMLYYDIGSPWSPLPHV